MTRKKYPREHLKDMPKEWEVNEAGEVWHHNHRQPVEMFGDKPAVDLKGKYWGPLPRSSAHPRTATTRADIAELKRLNRFRLVEEIVCYQWRGRPKSWADCEVIHLDGDPSNCGKYNLRWAESIDLVEGELENFYVACFTPRYIKPDQHLKVIYRESIIAKAKPSNPLCIPLSITTYQPD